MTPLSDSELLSRFALRRDERAFETLVERHGPLVLEVCRRMLKSEADAEDAAQAVFLVLARKAGALRQVRSLGAWLHRVAWCLAANAREKRRQRRRHEERAAKMSAAPNAPEEQPAPEWLAQLDQALNALPGRYREAPVLCHLQGLTQTEAARVAGCKESTLSMRLLRGRELMRRRLERRGVTLPAANLALLLTTRTQPAALPPGFAAATGKAALLFQARAGAAASRLALALAEEWLRRLVLMKIAGAAAAALVLAGALSATVYLNARAPLAEPANTTATGARNGAEPPDSRPVRAEAGRALEARIDLVLRRERLTEFFELIDQLLPAGAALRWRAPLPLQSGGRFMVEGEFRGLELQGLLDQLAARHGLRWRPVEDGVLLWEPASDPVRGELAGRLGAARAAGDAPRWEQTADEVLRGGDLELRREILRALADPNAPIAQAARRCAHRLAAEGTAVCFRGDGSLDAGLLACLKSPPDCVAGEIPWASQMDALPGPLDALTAGLNVPWALLLEVCPRGLAEALEAYCAQALADRPGSPGQEAARTRRLSYGFAALGAVVSREDWSRAERILGRLEDLDQALCGLATLARRGHEPSRVLCRGLSRGEVDRARWRRFTERGAEADRVIALVRARPAFERPAGWWRTDPRFGPRAKQEPGQMPWDPLYQEPALRALALGGDAETRRR